MNARIVAPPTVLLDVATGQPSNGEIEPTEGAQYRRQAPGTAVVLATGVPGSARIALVRIVGTASPGQFIQWPDDDAHYQVVEV